MERACRAFFDWFTGLFDDSHSIAIICGPGNNGGDGLGVARMLHEAGYRVEVFVFPAEKTSEDYSVNLERFHKMGTITTIDKELPVFHHDLIIDAIFGSGLSRDAGGQYAEVIDKINTCEGLVVAIDIPSGLRGDEPSSGSIVRADFTISFQYPKLGLLQPENGDYVGEWETVDIGLMQEAIQNINITNYVTEKVDISSLWPIRRKFDHKNRYGHLLLAGGSYGKMGAVVMAAKAALRTGSGLVTAHIPKCGYEIFQGSVPEAMASVDKAEKYLSDIESVSAYDVVGCGPGMDVEQSSVGFLRTLLQNQPENLVLDADALNILSDNRDLLSLLPQNSILTPHPGEFRRLVGDWKNDFHKLDVLKEFSAKYKVVVVLKGANSVITVPSGDQYFNPTGNPGMATGGSGDVLTGIVASLLGQWGDAVYAAVAGVYLHGLAGDLASLELGEDSLNATDIIDYLPDGIQEINQ